jgi:hypothetical protein
LIRTLSGHEDKITAVDISPKSVIVPFRFDGKKAAYKQEIKKENGYVKVKIEGEGQDKMDIQQQQDNGEQQHQEDKMEVEVEDQKGQECLNDPMLVGYRPTIQLVTSSFDRTWKIWETDPLAEI